MIRIWKVNLFCDSVCLSVMLAGWSVWSVIIS